MQHQPIVEKVNVTHEWAHRPYQLLPAPYHCCLHKHRRQDERQHPRAPDRCPFVPRHSYIRLSLSCSWECYVNSCWPSYTVRWQRFRPTLVLVMACCLLAPSLYVTSIEGPSLGSRAIPLQSPESNDHNTCNNQTFKSWATSPGDNVLNNILIVPQLSPMWNPCCRSWKDTETCWRCSC